MFKRKHNSWVICKYLPVAGGNLRNCSSENYLLLDYTGPGAKETTDNKTESGHYRADLSKMVTTYCLKFGT